MIRLQRPPIPTELAAREPAATRKLWEAWRRGEEPKADARVYAHPAVKRALRAAQRDKCAYCETVNPTSHDVVEHFRPKAGWRHARGKPLQKPGYFWLSYAWENLLFACDQCNDASHKENLFPLANPRGRATPLAPDASREQALLLDPYGPLDPEAHVGWNRDVPRPRDRSRRGRATIATFRLDGDDRRAEHRRGHLNRVDELLGLIERFPRSDPLRTEMRSEVLKFLDQSAPWSAMVRANFDARIRAI